jgi:MFS family permease
MSLRLGFFWTAMSLADILAGFLAYGLLRMRGVAGQSGWRWLFLIEVCSHLIVRKDFNPNDRSSRVFPRF